MASTKLAGTQIGQVVLGGSFMARKVLLEVKGEKKDLERVLGVCRAMRLQPNEARFIEGRGIFHFLVHVTCFNGEMSPAEDRNFQDFIRVIESLELRVEIKDRECVPLFCPPPATEAEPCGLGLVKKACPTCRAEVELFGPMVTIADGRVRKTYLSPRHPVRDRKSTCEDGGLWYIEYDGRCCWSVSSDSVPDEHCQHC